MTAPDFKIKPAGPISSEFIKRNILTFAEAAEFICQLPYARNADKYNLLTLFTDHCGTCSTKHALLKQLAVENDFTELSLVLGIVKMNAGNTPGISETLRKNNLDHIPEAHNYLKFNDHIFDYTKPGFKLMDSSGNIFREIEISPDQITNFKVEYHKQYIAEWLAGNKEINLPPAELWTIREQCIKDLAEN